MKRIRQYSTLLSLMFLVFSCTSHEDEKTQSADTSRIILKDTNISVNSETNINPYATVDVSPMDMSYFPVEYPKLKMANNNIAPPVVKVIYSRPHLGGRNLFNDVLKYGEPWRLGANESTEIQLYQDLTVQDKKIKTGRYILYCIPNKDKWTIIFNSNIDSWGLKQDTTKDVYRFDTPITHNTQSASVEFFTIVFEKTKAGADMVMAWGNVVARLPFVFNQAG